MAKPTSLLGVSGATWDAIYDIYVDMNTKENPATVVYKASIIQNTGEVNRYFHYISIKLIEAIRIGLMFPLL